MAKINEQNKILMVTDCYGWETAQAYLADPIASDSEDEKKLKKARKEAKANKEEKGELLSQNEGKILAASGHFMVEMPRAVSKLVTTASHPHDGAAGGQGTSPAVAGQLSQHSHCQLAPLLDHPQAFQFSLPQAEDSLDDNISSDNNVHDFCFNLCYDSVQPNQDVGFSDELTGESIPSKLYNSSGTKAKVEDDLDSDLGPRPELTSVKGWLAERLAFWQHMGASDFILEVTGKGYALPFVKEPEPAVSWNNQSAKNHLDFVTYEILRLLDQGCVKEVSRGEVHTINPLSVADNGKKLRLILDLRYINKHLRVQKFKYKDLRTFQNLFSKGDFFFKTDLKSGYHHLDILEGHQKYLGFSWCISGMQRSLLSLCLD